MKKSAHPIRNANPIAILLGLNFGILLLGFTEFFAPISGDTSIYAYYGRQITHGLILYRDLWDFKSPGVYYFFALLFKVFSDNLITLKVSEVLVNLIASYFIYEISVRFFSSNVALTGSTMYLLATNLGGYLNKDGPFPESYIPLLGLIGLFCWLSYNENKDRNISLFAAGICGGLLIIMKQSSISFALGVLFCLLQFSPLVDWKKIRSFLIFVVGIMTAILPWLVYFYLTNTLADFWDAVVVYPRLYPATTSFSNAVQMAISLIASSMQIYWLMWVLSLVGIILLIISIRSSKNSSVEAFRILLPWIGFGLVVIVLPGRFYERYLMEILIPVIFAGEYAVSRLFSTQIVELRVLGIVLGTLFIFSIVIQQLPRSLHMLGHRILSKEPTRSEAMANDPLFEASGISVFAWGDPRIPYVTGTKSTVKWLNTEPFLTTCSYVNSALVNEMMIELTSHPPTYFIDSSAKPLLSQSCLKGTPVDTFIAEKYELKAMIGDAGIYALKAGQ